MKKLVLVLAMALMLCGCGGVKDVSAQYEFPGAKKIESVEWDAGSMSRLTADAQDVESVYLAKCGQCLDSFGGNLTEWNEEELRCATITGGSSDVVVVAIGKHVYVAISEDTDKAIEKIKDMEGV